MIKRKKKKETPTPSHYFEAILDQIDIAKGAFFQNNEHFVLTVGSKKSEDVLQIIHRQMAEETQSESGEFGLSICVELDSEWEADQQKEKLLKQYRHFGNFVKSQDENMVFYTMLLPFDSEKAAEICTEIIQKVYLIKQQDLLCAFYDVER